ncbi:uncharacterized protein KD926_005851 [Aspergillus affinis]|uniref:uncharacterized protein n=1 Tax=Aspergillus affinis TaxID=1070780 RepID=UPI0022FDBEF2|nr:uncharacterized protein KD926_005851 [Aspergillus affinis]KAI9045908.1 hypothetical protein KD926_005851 [Aspergillus affinis]
MSQILQPDHTEAQDLQTTNPRPEYPLYSQTDMSGQSRGTQAPFANDPYSNLPAIGIGMTGIVLDMGEGRVVKKAKKYQTGQFKDPGDMEYINKINQQALENEIQVFQRLGSHKGIIPYFQTSEYGIELARAQEDLESYLATHPERKDCMKIDWILSLIETFAYIHSHRVFVDDIALRNILVLDEQLKLADFGQSILLPMDTDMASANDNGLDVWIEILHLGWILYSIASWNIHKYYFFGPENPDCCWPEPDSFPDVDGILFGKIIEKCWRGEYAFKFATSIYSSEEKKTQNRQPKLDACHFHAHHAHSTMQIRSTLWNPSLFLYLLSAQAAWVRKFHCASSQPTDPAEKAFRIDSLHGSFDTVDSPTRFILSILGVHNVSKFTCNDLDLTGIGDSAQLHVLGHPVGSVEYIRSECPLPITDTLTPPEGLLFSNFEIGYSFSHTHRLQTLETEISFPSQNGVELDCAAVKITPDIGKAASAAFTFIPLAVMAIVGLASWYRRVHASESDSLIEHQNPHALRIWAAILDVSDYIRYLQFILLAGSLTMEYPGFYQPVASQVAWSSLLYWSGPIDHGFTYKGVEDGMYVSNGSYGLEYMSQMLGFPQMPDIMFDAFINLFLLLSGLAVVLMALYLGTFGPSQKLPFGLTFRNGGYIIIGLVLSFYSFPLLSFMSYELILIGYLPNYRVVLVGLGMVLILLANYLITRYFDQLQEVEVSSQWTHDQSSVSREIFRAISHYLPHAIPLIQGIIIGGLQDYSLTQILVLGCCEVIFLVHSALQQRLEILTSRNAWCAGTRLLTLCLSTSFTTSLNETGRQWIGYLMLCLHGAVILTYCLLSSWHLWRTSRKGKLFSGRGASPSLSLTDLDPIRLRANDRSTLDSNSLTCPKSSSGSFTDHARPGSSGTSSYRGIEIRIGFNNYSTHRAPLTSTPANIEHGPTDSTEFYRAPRARIDHQYLYTESGDSSTPDNIGAAAEAPSAEPTPELKPTNRMSQNTLDEWLNVPERVDIDYSVRESDQYYGRMNISDTVSESSSTVGLTREVGSEASRKDTVKDWTQRASRRLKPPKKPKEKGFQVVRPKRPPGPPTHP